jgi:hypothetical protein
LLRTLNYHLKSLKISFPFSKSNKIISRIKPTTCAYFRNLCPGFLSVIISQSANTICRPSKAGIGNEFINPSTIGKMRLFSRDGS